MNIEYIAYSGIVFWFLFITAFNLGLIKRRSRKIHFGQSVLLTDRAYKIIHEDRADNIPVPLQVARCPYCGDRLIAEVYQWVEDMKNPGYWVIDGINVECLSAPDINSLRWENWSWQHSEFIYVYQLPVDQRIENWFRKNFRTTT